MQPGSPVQGSTLENGERLAPAAQVLSDPARERPFHILILGDSHHAADHISGAFRARLQAEHGSAGRGVLPAGLPYDGFTVRQASLAFSGVRAVSRRDGDQSAGLSGFVGVTQPGARIDISTEPEAAFDRLTVCYLAEPGAGVLEVSAGGEIRQVFAEAGIAEPRCEQLDLTSRTTFASVAARDRQVRIFSWAATTQTGGGVTVSNLGVIGETVRSLLSRDGRVLRAEMQAYRPDLILLAFGTNEGFERDFDEAEYAGSYLEALNLLRAVAPGAAILAMGPPDAAMTRPDLYYDGVDQPIDYCFPLTPDELANYDALVAARDPGLERWYAPPALGRVREIQRRVANEAGVAFWDWEARMGGPCSVDRWFREEPPAARGDHVHFNRLGGDRIGGWLAEDLLAALSGGAD